MINRVILVGRLGNDPEVRKFDNGSSVSRFGLATSDPYKDEAGNWQEKTDWHNVVAWNTLSERAVASLKKGDLVYVEGKITTRKWQDTNGVDRSTTDIVSNYFRIVSSAKEGGARSNSNFPSPSDAPKYATSYEAPMNPTAATNNFPDASAADDDLPF